jgi:hypothetical protein
MLTLVNPLEIEGYTVYRDDAVDVANIDAGLDATLAKDRATTLAADPGGATGGGGGGGSTQPQDLPRNMRFYVLPKTPTMATDGNGKPLFSLIVYRKDISRVDPNAPKDDVGGGILTFTIELSVPDAAMKRIEAQLRSKVFGDSPDNSQQIELTPVEFLDGTVTIAVAGENTGTTTATNMFVKSAVGTGKVSGLGNNKRAVMVNLTQDGASLMSKIDKLRTMPINVAYDLSFENRLLGVKMRVWCDVTSSYHLLQSHETAVTGQTDGYLSTGLGSHDQTAEKVTSVTEMLVSSKTAGVEVIPQTSQVDNDTITSLEKFGEDLLNKELEKALTAQPPPATIDRNYLDKYFQDYNDELNFTLDREMVLVRNYSVSTNLANVLNRPDLDQLVTYVDLQNVEFVLLSVPVRVNADFTKLPISHVVVTLEYRAQKADKSGWEDTVASFDFTDGTSVQKFVAYAESFDQVTYNWTATVHYKDSATPFTFRKNNVKDRFLVVDVGTLGLIAVDIGFGLVDLDKYPEATVAIRYVAQSTNLGTEQTFKLDKDNDSASWTDIVREESTNAYQYKVDWRRKSDNQILAGTWTPSNSTRLKLPPAVVDHLDVGVVASGNFKDGSDPIIHIVVSLQYTDPDNNYTQEGRLDFTDDKQLLTWSCDLRNGANRAYRYRYDIIYKGGLVKHVPPDQSWKAGQPGFLVVGESYQAEVTIYPFLINYAQTPVVKVDMTYSDGITNSFVFTKDSNTPRVWRAGTDPTGPRGYTINVTYQGGPTGDVKLPTINADSEAFVIPALATPPPT